MAEPIHQALAERLRGAYAGVPVEPLRDGLDPDDVDGAYAVQAINTRFWVDQGRRIAGRKIGLTAAAVQKQLGVDQPDFGVIFQDTVLMDGDRLSPLRLLQPKAEAEVALVLARDIEEEAPTVLDILKATDFALPAIEVVDSRIADWRITFADTVADNASSAYVVLGAEPRLVSGLDLFTCGMVMQSNGQIVSLGVGAACLGHPLQAAAWLARTLAARGEPLRAGDIVMTGALGPMSPLTPGQRVHAEIAGLGEVSFSFGEEPGQ